MTLTIKMSPRKRTFQLHYNLMPPLSYLLIENHCAACDYFSLWASAFGFNCGYFVGNRRNYMKCSVKFNWKVLLILPPISNVLQRVWDMIHPMGDHELRAGLEAPDRRELITEWVRKNAAERSKSASQWTQTPRFPGNP